MSDDKRTMSNEELDNKLQPISQKISLFSTIETVGTVAFAGGIILCFIVGFTMIVLVVVGLIVIGIALDRKGKLQAEYDEIFNTEVGVQIENMISSHYGPQLASSEKAPYSYVGELNYLHLTGPFTNMSSDSYREGVWKGKKMVGFNASFERKEEVEYQDDDGTWRTRTETTQVFGGPWVIFEMNQEIPSLVSVCEVKKKKQRKDPFWNIKMENDAFNERFCIHADDEHLAYYILTPQFMEKLMNAADLAGVKCGGFAFCGNKMYMAMDGGRRFLNRGKTLVPSEILGELAAALVYYDDLFELITDNNNLFD